MKYASQLNKLVTVFQIFRSLYIRTCRYLCYSNCKYIVHSYVLYERRWIKELGNQYDNTCETVAFYILSKEIRASVSVTWFGLVSDNNTDCEIKLWKGNSIGHRLYHMFQKNMTKNVGTYLTRWLTSLVSINPQDHDAFTVSHCGQSSHVRWPRAKLVYCIKTGTINIVLRHITSFWRVGYQNEYLIVFSFIHADCRHEIPRKDARVKNSDS